MLNTEDAVEQVLDIALDNLSKLISTITERTTLTTGHNITNLRYRVDDTFRELIDNLEEELADTMNISNLHRVLQFGENNIKDALENYRKETN